MKHTLFVNGKIVLSNGILEQGKLMAAGDRILDILPEERGRRGTGEGKKDRALWERADEVVDLEGKYLAPGFIDIHVHGGGGGDFMDGERESWQQALETHLRHGTTAVCPTTLTASTEEMEKVFALYREFRRERGQGCEQDRGRGQGQGCERSRGCGQGLERCPERCSRRPRLLGLHMEGPYIAESMEGAQDARYIRKPEKELTDWLLEKGAGVLRILTAAPELEGIGEVARAARKAGVLLSVGHSDARLEDVEQAVRDGYTMVTHLYSSMSTIVRENGMRRPGVLEAALLSDKLDVEVIGDGMHLPVSLLRLILKTKGADHMILVTDAMRAAGLPPGQYKLGSLRRGQTVWSDGNIARMPDGISFAGSVATADRLIRVLYQEAGIPLWQAVKMMTRNPARALGEEEIGALAPGKKADLVIFDEHICIDKVYLDGDEIKCPDTK